MNKQELEEKIEQLQKQLDELKNVKVDETKRKWIPAVNDEYFYINSIYVLLMKNATNSFLSPHLCSTLCASIHITMVMDVFPV